MTTLTQRFDDAPGPVHAEGAEPAPAPRHALDTEPMRVLGRQLEEWWYESLDKHAVNRAERFIDHDYHDHDQLTHADRQAYEERGQAPVVHNLVKPAIDWLTGTERRTRIDWKVLPRGPEDEQGAKAQTQLVKFISDANGAGWERSEAFKDAAISGVGFIEEFIRQDEGMEPIGYAYLDWRYVWWDPFSRQPDFSDARYVHRAKLVDLDIAIAMFPDREADLTAASVQCIDDEYSMLDDLDGAPSMLVLSGHRPALQSATGTSDRHARRRVRLIETWYPRHQTTKRVKALLTQACDEHGVLFDASKHDDLLKRGCISLVDAVTKKMAVAIWAPGLGLLSHADSPYRHNRFPFTGVWAFRHHRDGMPYGYVRGMRDPQDEYNKRRAKALYAASVNRVLFEDDAFDAEDEEESLEQIGRMNGEVRLAPGGLKKIQIDTGLEVAATHVNFMQEAKQQVYEGSGITRENLAHDTNAISGRAILAKQQQGAVSTAEVFDHYRYAIQFSGQKLLSLIGSHMTLPRKIRVLGQNEGVEWVAINEPRVDPLTGAITWLNDMAGTQADFVVGEQDFRETIRMAMAESLMETIGKLPPELAIQLIDLAVDLTDLPNKDEFVRRVRQMNGQMPAKQTPEQIEQKAAADAQQQQAAELERREREARIAKEEAGAEKLRADARKSNVDGKAAAMNTAHLIAASLPLAAAADELHLGAAATPPSPVQPGVIPA